ncbi:MAG: diaminopimelate decarboxylase [Ferrovum sp. 37-45-19]|jgi:diaminopimelate decarboxylase|uniref:diaminopimelate decarboxylase n=1 Tax=Ferrovum sp. JA12 TaxID=1356299 RepID=UPI0007039FFE|nr:diaminopimelate decarboxylase [Ferrovum sp. JA12]OYV79579.1 MAG: diaminopimelate decarboxylase [Ferrovum sp. 21-44-67]OYV94626.1 MAG: diaminopimelate decarboxylase [Ferrovum sp. 37-45-19]OZB34547.1 MAG: diaminopimelate decarboxylase [Ferrovum sp. 34-44-207]HQT81500.1 diaminopimelate decarboxylase [Ferrovaceae bacterium]KRH79469.1 diaminopimelate decarboxylase [Ferrovum sp. JA12]
MANLTPFPELSYHDNQLHLDEVSLTKLAELYGTPLYVYSYSALVKAYNDFKDAFKTRDTLICYAVKANGNLSLLRELANLGAGFDIVSMGELQRVLQAGGDPQKIVFSGVGKSIEEINYALKTNIFCFNIESEQELYRINECALNLGKKASISFRVNPDVDPMTHPYISTGLKNSKFGVPFDTAIELYRKAHLLSHVQIKGIDCHIGSQITELEPFIEALERILELILKLNDHGIAISHLDLGGGLGITYKNETIISLNDYAQALLSRLNNFNGQLIFEPGRRIIGNSGLLLTRVEYLKQSPDHNFAIVDAAMNDLVRPSLYDAWHEVVEVKKPAIESNQFFDVVGPVCETGDILASNRSLEAQPKDLLAILSAGAYGSSMGSNYNARPRAPEVLVFQDQHYLISRRESHEELTQRELTDFFNLPPLSKII